MAPPHRPSPCLSHTQQATSILGSLAAISSFPSSCAPLSSLFLSLPWCSNIPPCFHILTHTAKGRHGQSAASQCSPSPSAAGPSSPLQHHHIPSSPWTSWASPHPQRGARGCYSHRCPPTHLDGEQQMNKQTRQCGDAIPSPCSLPPKCSMLCPK
ncbi:hypothetical protein U9M48_028606, partial [Paspalum notatum var. saurae]